MAGDGDGSEIESRVREASGDRDLRGGGIEAVFATAFTSDDCITALWRAQKRFSPLFPGWALYRRVVTGDGLLDRKLEAYAIGMARGVARADKANGRQVVSGKTRRKPGWVAQAGRDGLDYGLFGRFPDTVEARADYFGIAHQTYRRLRDSVGGGITEGIRAFQSEVECEYLRIKRAQKFGSPE